MRRGYSQDIRAEAITKRFQGKTWTEVKDDIEGKYGVRPSMRQMQKWVEDYHGDADPTGVRQVVKAIEDAANLAQPLAQARMMGEVMPLWWELMEKHRVPFVDAGWMAFVAFFETQIGRDNFDRVVKGYMELRDKVSLPPRPQPKRAWKVRPITRHSIKELEQDGRS